MIGVTMEMQIVVLTVTNVHVVDVEPNRVMVRRVLPMLTATPTGVKDLMDNWGAAAGENFLQFFFSLCYNAVSQWYEIRFGTRQETELECRRDSETSSSLFQLPEQES